MDNIERYLCLATWGLWGEHKRTVRMELSSHIQHKANQYEALGYTPSAAVSRALNDLGPPHVVSAGMNGVYTMPNILRNTLLCAVLATLGIGNLTSSVAQVVATSRVPIEDCADDQQSFKAGTQSWPCETNSIWLSISSLRVTLEAKGVKFSQPLGSPKVGATLYVGFPEAKGDVTLTPQRSIGFRPQTGTGALYPLNPDFVSSMDFYQALVAAGLPIQIKGWENPQISVGQTTFTIGTSEKPMQGGVLQRDAISKPLLETMFPAIFPQSKTVDTEDLLIVTTFANPITSVQSGGMVGYAFTVKVRDAKPNDLYLVLSREGPTNMIEGSPQLQNVRRAFVTHVNADGTIPYISPSKKLTISSPNKLPRCVIDGEGTISVLRFSGRIDFSVTDTLTRVAPEDVTIQAVK